MSTSGESSFLNSPFITTVTGYIVYLQEQNIVTKERLLSLKNHFLITIGFLVLLYCLIHIQLLFFWLLKFIFRLIFQFISFIFWLPLKTVRFIIPRTIDYDILFPVFWLCSISSFYISKHFHENICQFFDQFIVRRYRIFQYDQTKREDIKRYIFVSTFTVLIVLQSLFIMVPITLSIRNRHTNEKLSSKPVITTTMETLTAKSAVKDVVETMSGNLYNRFINAFQDENEAQMNEKRPPLVSDEQLEDTLKTLKKSITQGINDLKPTNEQNQDKKSSRFQRWIVHYLKAPFQKWDKKTNEQISSNIEQKYSENESEEVKEENINSSLNTDDTSESDDDELEEQKTAETVEHVSENIKDKISSSTDDDDDDEEEEDSPTKVSSSDDEDEDEDEESDDDQSDDDEKAEELTEQSAEPIEKAENSTQTVESQLQDELSSSVDQDDDDSDEDDDNDDDDDDDDDDEEESIVSKVKEQLAKPIEKVRTIAETVSDQIRNAFSSSSVDQEDNENEDSGYDSDDEEDDNESSKLLEKIRNTLAEPIETAENTASDITNKITSSDNEEDESDSDEESISIAEKIRQRLNKPIETVRNLGEKVSSSFSNDEEDLKIESDDDDNEEDHTKQIAEESIEPITEKTSLTLDELKRQAEKLINSTGDFAAYILEESVEHLPRPAQVVEPIKTKVNEFQKVVKTKGEQLKTAVVNKVKSLKKKKKSKTLTEKVKDKFRSFTKKLPGHQKKPKKSKFHLQNKLNGWIDEAWNVWHLTRTKLGHIFISSTKHARHLPRYNTTSLYTAYTDIKCYDYTKKLNRYRLLKRKYNYFLDLYRQHSPFPVYLSVLRTNGPRCYRQYPNSSCGVIPKSSPQNFKAQLYRFVRFWAVIGVIVILLATVYKHYINRKQTNSSSFRPRDDFDRSSTRTDLSKPTIQRPSSIPQQTISTNNNNSNNNISPLNEQIKTRLHRWLEYEQNDGYRNLSETCRQAINNTFLKQLVSSVDKQPSLS